VPTVSAAVDPLVAMPPLTVAGEPNGDPSIVNCTVPVASLGVRVAVKVTD
jgi:hypothetical protein